MEQRAGTWALLVQRPRSAAPTHKNKTYPVFLTTPCATAHAPRTRGPWYSTTSKVLNPKPTPRKRMRVRLFCPQQICIPQTSRAVSLLSLSTRGACAQQCSLRCEARGEVRAHAWCARTSGVGGISAKFLCSAVCHLLLPPRSPAACVGPPREGKGGAPVALARAAGPGRAALGAGGRQTERRSKCWRLLNGA